MATVLNNVVLLQRIMIAGKNFKARVKNSNETIEKLRICFLVGKFFTLDRTRDAHIHFY